MELISKHMTHSSVTNKVNRTNKRPDSYSERLWLPEELWLKVISEHADSIDFHRFCLAFPKFGTLMHSKKQLLLFSEIFPHICTYLQKKDVLNLWLVCKNWNYGVNNILEKCRQQHLNLLKKIKLNTTDCNTPLLLERLHNFNETGIVSLPPGRAVHLYFHKYFEDINVVVKDFIKPFGNNIINLELSIVPNSFQEFSETLYFCLSHCPNLLSLSLCGIYSYREAGSEVKLKDETRVVVEAREYLRPVWSKKLTYVRFDGGDDAFVALVQNMCVFLTGPEVTVATVEKLNHVLLR